MNTKYLRPIPILVAIPFEYEETLHCFIYNIFQFSTFTVISLLRPREVQEFSQGHTSSDNVNVKTPSLKLHCHYKPPGDTNVSGWLWGPCRKTCSSYNRPIFKKGCSTFTEPQEVCFYAMYLSLPFTHPCSKTKTHNGWPVGRVLKSSMNQ